MLHSIPYNLFDVAQHLFNVFLMPLSSFNIFWGHFEFPQLSLEFVTLPISLQSFLGSAPCLSKVFFVTLTSILQHFPNIVWCLPNLFPMLPSSPNVHPLFEKNSQCPMMFSWHCLTSSTSPLCYTTPPSHSLSTSSNIFPMLPNILSIFLALLNTPIVPDVISTSHTWLEKIKIIFFSRSFNMLWMLFNMLDIFLSSPMSLGHYMVFPWCCLITPHHPSMPS